MFIGQIFHQLSYLFSPKYLLPFDPCGILGVGSHYETNMPLTFKFKDVVVFQNDLELYMPY